MMKSNRDNFIFYLTQIVPVIVALVISIIIYRYWSDNNKACLALTWAAIIFLFLCFYNIIFKNKRNGMIIPILSGLSILLFANKFYDYDTLKTLLPILKNIDSSLFAIMLLGGLLFLLLFAKFVVYLCSDSENSDSISEPSKHTPVLEGQKNNNKITPLSKKEHSLVKKQTTNTNSNQIWIPFYFLFLTILIGSVCAVSSILYTSNIWENNYNFFNIIVSLLKYAGFVVTILLAFIIVILFLIEMIRLIVTRMKAFSRSLKEESAETGIPLYVLSAILDIIICYLAYSKFSDFTADQFYDWVNKGEYLLIPLMLLLIGVAFVLFLRLTHATLYKTVEKDLKNTNKQKKLDQTKYQNAKYALATAKSALADYNNSQETIIANFLVEMLKPTPDSKVLQDYISKLNNKILDMSKKDNIIKEYSEIVEMTQELTITVNNYISLVEMQSSSTKNSTTSIKTLRKKISTNIAIPSPTEKSFSKDYSVWQNEWHSRLNNLENLIQQLPQLSKGDKKLLDTTVINIDLLENYNINENIETINQLRRNKISDINVVEKATSLLFGKYWFTA